MKLGYIFIITFVTFNVTFAYEIPRQNEIIYQKAEYKSLINRANSAAVEGDADKSLKLAKKAYKIKPSKEALLIMARVYNYKKEFGHLKECAEKILEKSPKNYLGNIYLANAYFKTDKAKAKQILENLLKIYPEDSTVVKKLSYFKTKI